MENCLCEKSVLSFGFREDSYAYSMHVLYIYVYVFLRRSGCRFLCKDIAYCGGLFSVVNSVNDLITIASNELGTAQKIATSCRNVDTTYLDISAEDKLLPLIKGKQLVIRYCPYFLDWCLR